MFSKKVLPITKHLSSVQCKNNRKTVFFARIFLFPVLAFSISSTVQAAESCEVIGRLASAEGLVEVQHVDTSKWTNAKTDDSLCQGDTVRAGINSRGAIALTNNAILRVDQNSTVQLLNITAKKEESSVISLLKGAIQSFSRKPSYFSINTAYLNGSIEGTEFVFRVKDNSSELTVLEGRVVASNEQGKVAVGAGQLAVAESGQAPEMRTLIRPRDAAQWSLYYPPILAAGDSASESLQQAASKLSVGQVDAARSSVDQAIADNNADAGLAYALRAVINVVQNNQTQALDDANQAVRLSPDSAAAKIALSYAQQAGFQIVEARDTLLQAVHQQPENALAWARLAELQLMSGNRAQAQQAAEKAASIEPELARTQSVVGFSALAGFENDKAASAFTKALATNSADPLPHLGLGLSKISNGELSEGRRELEIAVSLDANNALMRAYLGKAYFEERRSPLDAQQFEIAKTLDPMDPTAYLYDGIRLQTEGRPVEALASLQESYSRNDNRATYRSRLLLDKDRASRGTSLARAYSDLGFTQLGINESSESLMVDPANASAHRFLSDTYRSQRRREISRVSEELQAQLLQDVNINPVQPSQSETSLNVITSGGPASAGFNEFTPLFQRNQAQANVNAFVGNNQTEGGEVVVSGVYDNFSVSVGAFTYDTDGFRENNGISHEVQDIFLQAAVTEKLNVQLEYRNRESEEGDLDFNFDPDNFSPQLMRERDTETIRFGLRYSATPQSHFLLSYINSDRDETLHNETSNPFIPPFIPVLDNVEDSLANDEGDQTELQYIHQFDTISLIGGVAYSESDRQGEINVGITPCGLLPLPFPPPDDVVFIPCALNEQIDITTEQTRAYLYANANLTSSLLLTLGVSYFDYEEVRPDSVFDEDEVSPKLGLQWGVTQDLNLRFAALETVKPSLTSNRTIEPTQIAGFNQFYDDINATKSQLLAGGIDWHVSNNLSVGAEATWRELDEPALFLDFTALPPTESTVFEERKEQLHKLYAYWTPMNSLAVNAELIYDLYEADSGVLTQSDSIPEEVKTYSLPLSLTYFNTSRFYITLGATYVDQEVIRDPFATKAQGESDFTLVDAAIGYRFNKRRGNISLGVKNISDKEFAYQDDSYREFRDEPSVGPYFPERTIMGSLTLSF